MTGKKSDQSGLLTNSMIRNTQKFDKIMQMSSLSYYQWFKESFMLDKEKFINAFIKGFEESYFLEEEVIQTIQAIQKE